MENRIDIYNQIKAFYSIVFNSSYDIRTAHVSLYMFLLNQNNRNMWVEWFKCPFDLAMQGALISSKTTYYKTLDDLVKFKLIQYEKGINTFKAPKIKILVLSVPKNDTVTVPQSEQVSVPIPVLLYGQLSVPLPVHIYRLITNNIKPITEHYLEVERFIEGLNVEGVPPSPPTKKNLPTRKDEFRLKCIEVLSSDREKFYQEKDENKKFFDYWTEHGEKDLKMRFEKEKSFDIALRLDRWFEKAKANQKKNFTGGAEPESKTARMLRELEDATNETVARVQAEELINQ